MEEAEPWVYLQPHYTGWSVAHRLDIIMDNWIARHEDIF
jgi:hypothetical protein